VSGTARTESHVPFEDSIPQASLESILCTEELQRRPSRPPDYEKENHAFVKLVSALTDFPTTIFQTLAQTILDITQCDSAGLSLLTRDGKTPDVGGERFYWPAIAGMWNPHVGGGTPRNFGPCGDVLDQNRTLLFRHFERRYPYLLPVIPAAEECLLVPFYVAGEAVGTIWAIMHSDRRNFDAEDDRVMASLGKFASSAYQARMHMEYLNSQIAEREKAEAELRKLTDSLEEKVRARTAELQRSEERLRLAQQAARIGTFEWNIQSGVDTWTPEMEAMYGLQPGSFGGTETAFENLIHPDDRAEVIELVDAAMRSGRPTKGEWRVVWADGSVHWIAGRWQVFMNESGEPSRMVGINIDITERKRAEEALRASEERLHLAIESGSVGGWDYNLKTGRRVWFGETHAQLGMALDEAPGSVEESWERIHKDDREHLQHALRVARDKHEQFNEEFRVVWRDGTTRWVRSRGRFFYAANGQPERLLGLSVDITERKLAEDALQESEQRFRLVANTAPVMIWMSGLDKKPTYFNQLWLDFTGLSETDLQNGLAGIVHPEDYEQCHEVYCRGFDQRQPFRKECRLRRHDGQYRWMLDIGVPRFQRDGSFAGYIGSCIDVTERKQAEDALSGMTRKLVEAQEQERTRIARELHDDINQRLAMLAVGLEQLKNDPSDVRNRVSELRKGIAEISNDVQALSHDLHSSALEYLGAVAGMKGWCKEFGKRRGMQVNCSHDVRSTLPPEIGLCLFRVLQEALHNVAKHSGVKRVEVELSENSGEIRLTIRDLGRGFDVEAVQQGKGLGLTSMRERVRLVNGTITIDSKPKGGTTVHVRVPFILEQGSQQAAG
jgi:PAS domain S-box-containing protein